MNTQPVNNDDENLWDDPLVKAGDTEFDYPEPARRFMGFFADVVATAIAYYMLLFAVYYIYQQSSSVPVWLFEGAIANLIPVLVYLILVGGMELLTGGQSIGKIVSGTVVVDSNGQPAKPGQIAVRTLCRLIPGEALMVVFDHQKRAGHDSISRTKVIRKNPFSG